MGFGAYTGIPEIYGFNEVTEREDNKMILKNKQERENFINNYKAWGVWKEVSELNLKFYRYELPTGAVIIVTEYMTYIGYKKTYVTSKKFCLILPEDDEYTKEHTYGAEYLRTYTPDNTSVSTITDYMTKNRDKIDV